MLHILSVPLVNSKETKIKWWPFGHSEELLRDNEVELWIFKIIKDFLIPKNIV